MLPGQNLKKTFFVPKKDAADQFEDEQDFASKTTKISVRYKKCCGLLFT
jgi:hypothetical protein